MNRQLKPIRLPARIAPAYAMPRDADAQPTPAEVKAIFENLQRGFDAFKAGNDRRVDEIEAELRGMNSRFALASIGGAFDHADSVQARKDRQLFAQFCRGQIKAGMSTDSNPDGGFLVPEYVEKGVGQLAIDLSPMRRLARIVTVGTGVYKKLFSTNGTEAGWTKERASRPETQGMKLTENEYPVHELYANPAVTQTLLDDAEVDVAGEVSFEIARAFELKESLAFVRGSGVNQPRGFLEQTTVANASWAWGKIGFLTSGVAAALSDGSNNGLDRLNSLLYSLKTEYRRNSTWLMNSTTASVVSQLKDDNGNYLWQPSVQLGQPPSLYGRPVEIDENIDDIGAGKFPIALGDFQRAYLIVDHVRSMRVVRDNLTMKPFVQFYTTKRVGGNVADFNAIKLLKIAA